MRQLLFCDPWRNTLLANTDINNETEDDQPKKYKGLGVKSLRMIS